MGAVEELVAARFHELAVRFDDLPGLPDERAGGAARGHARDARGRRGGALHAGRGGDDRRAARRRPRSWARSPPTWPSAGRRSRTCSSTSPAGRCGTERRARRCGPCARAPTLRELRARPARRCSGRSRSRSCSSSCSGRSSPAAGHLTSRSAGSTRTAARPWRGSATGSRGTACSSSRDGTQEASLTQMRKGDLDAVIVVPAGTGARARGGRDGSAPGVAGPARALHRPQPADHRARRSARSSTRWSAPRTWPSRAAAGRSRSSTRHDPDPGTWARPRTSCPASWPWPSCSWASSAPSRSSSSARSSSSSGSARRRCRAGPW